MSRDEIDEIDERLRAALRHAPDAQRQAPPELTARILAGARAQANAAAQLATSQASQPSRRPRWLGAGTLGLAPRGLALGLAAAVGLAAIWLSQRPGEGALRDLQQAPQLAQAPAAPSPAALASEAPPVVVALVTPSAAPAVAQLQAKAAPARKPAAPRADTLPVPEIVAMAPPPPMPAAEFRPAPAATVAAAAPPPAAAKPAAALASAAAEREPSGGNPPREWLARLPAAEPALRDWLQALAELSEGRWSEGRPAPAARDMQAGLALQRRERAGLADSLAATQAESWHRLELGGQRVSLRWLPQGLLWCEAERCRFVALSEADRQRLQGLLPSPAASAPREPAQ